MAGSDRIQRNDALMAKAFCALAIFGAVFLLYTLGLLNGRESERRHQTPASYSQAAQVDAQRVCAGKQDAALFECVYVKVEASQEQARGEQDLSAQQRAASAALVSAVVALLALVATVIGVWFVKRTLDATLKAVEDSGKATEAMQEANRITLQSVELAELQVALTERSSKQQLRSYLGFKIVEHPIFGPGIDPTAKFKIKNYGQTPAYQMRFEAALVLAEPVNPPLAVLDFRPDGSSGTLYPNEETTSHLNLAITLDEDLCALIYEGVELAIYLYGEVKYTDIFKEEHSLHFRYRMSGKWACEAGRLGLTPEGNSAT